MDREDILQYSQAVCKGLRDDDDGLRREVLAHAGSRWSLGTRSMHLAIVIGSPDILS